MNDLDVHALLRRAQKGDAQAWNELATEFRRLLLDVAAKVLGPGWQGQSFEDVAHDAIIRARTYLPGYHGAERPEEERRVFTAWIEKIAHSEAINHQLKKQTQGRSPGAPLQSLTPARNSDPSDSGVVVSVADSIASPSVMVMENERKVRIEAALAALEPKHQQVVRLLIFEGLKMRETAEQIGCDEKTVRKRFNAALKQLGPKLEGLL